MTMALLPLKQFVSPQACAVCDVCCRFSERISAWHPRVTQRELSTFIENGYPPVFFSAEKNIRAVIAGDIFACPFFAPLENACSVYRLRPFECRLYPFLLSRGRDGIYIGVDTQCPYAKERLSTEELKRYTVYLREALATEDMAEMFVHNPHLIGDYSTEESIVILEELPLQ